ncbi:MAG TPA: hypothetical protein PLJ04_02610 [Candidatus Saccharibacteria bacterium]|nr:hypothetical protein [Candidatus Saccharibacteria bacterium]MCB9817814.1 hypothetical protein [Candidatus Nomurabacteria bacterium]HPD98962.1 hypothetical protein [Candidatus Saccharibacteria bacterium]HPR10449.1 hypothetical protein [Candidatus Saccharibacteria bacterium]
MNILYTFSAIISSDYLPKTNTNSFGTILNYVLAIFGAVAVIMVVYSGIQLIISQGNSEKVAQARRAIIYAVAGLVVIFFAQVIVLFIFNRVT